MADGEWIGQAFAIEQPATKRQPWTGKATDPGKKPESFRSKGKIIAFPVYTWKETSFCTLDAVGLMKCKCTGWIYSGWSVVGVKSGSSDVIAFRNG